MLKLDTDLLEPFITQSDVLAHQDAISRILAELRNGTCPGNKFLGWLDLPLRDHHAETQQILSTAAEIRQADCLVVVGIGGSYLGARAIQEALAPRFPEHDKQTEILFIGHHLSADYTNELLRHLEGKNYYINVISKSGGTTEPGIAFRLLLEHLEKRVSPPEMSNRILATTDPAKGMLRQLAHKKYYRTFDLPANVGGRFSVLTPVGLLPLAVAGIDIVELLHGASDMAAFCAHNDAIEANPALRYAASRHQLYQSGKKIELLSVWEPYLTFFAEWWKQLYGESEGKDKKGLFPASVSLSTDLHSMGQYIQDGLRILFETFLLIDASEHTCMVPQLADDADGMNFLAKKDLAEVNRIAYQGTALAHQGGGVPSMTLHLPRRTAYHLGQLVYFFEYAVAVSGLLLGINPFDQPGVEDYKDNMFALLGKPGYEGLREVLLTKVKI